MKVITRFETAATGVPKETCMNTPTNYIVTNYQPNMFHHR